MRWNWIDKLALAVFLLFSGLYGYIAITIVGNDQLKSAFDVIQGVHVFDVDDTYRLFLARAPFVAPGLWAWNFYLPVNIVVDGFLSWLTNHDVLLMRSAHLLAVQAGLFLTYRAGRHLNIAAGWMLLACLLLLAMPLYILLSMSFYGESLLAAAMGVVIHAIATRKEKRLVFFLSLFPLIRPEGFLFLAMMSVQRFLERRWLSLFFIMLPGFVFFCGIMWLFDFSYTGFKLWRMALTTHYPLVPQGESVLGYPLMPYYAINPLFWMIALTGAFLPGLRRYRPLFLGLALLMLNWGMDGLALKARAEPRYFFAAFPLLALSAAAMAQAASDYLQRKTLKNKALNAWQAAAMIVPVFAFILVENTAQIDPVRAQLFKDRRWPLAGEPGAKTYFGVLPPEAIAWRKSTAAFLQAYTRYDSSIKKIIIHAYPVFADIDPGQLPEAVEVQYSPMMPKVTFAHYGGYFFAMFPRVPQFTFYRFSQALESTPNDGKHYALYVGPLYNGEHEPIFANPLYQVYKVNYMTTQHLPLAIKQK